MRYVHKPVTVDAIQWNGENIEEIDDFVSPNGSVNDTTFSDRLVLSRKSDNNTYIINVGDWIIKRSSGCIYSCSKESFKNNYNVAFPNLLN